MEGLVKAVALSNAAAAAPVPRCTMPFCWKLLSRSLQHAVIICRHLSGVHIQVRAVALTQYRSIQCSPLAPCQDPRSPAVARMVRQAAWARAVLSVLCMMPCHESLPGQSARWVAFADLREVRPAGLPASAASSAVFSSYEGSSSSSVTGPPARGSFGASPTGEVESQLRDSHLQTATKPVPQVLRQNSLAAQGMLQFPQVEELPQRELALLHADKLFRSVRPQGAPRFQAAFAQSRLPETRSGSTQQRLSSSAVDSRPCPRITHQEQAPWPVIKLVGIKPVSNKIEASHPCCHAD